MAAPNMTAITSVIPKFFASGVMAAGANTVYSPAAGKAAKLTKLVLCNTGGPAVTLSVALVPSGQAIDGTHRVVNNYSLPGNDTLVVDETEGMWVADGDKVVVTVGTAAVIAVTLNGLEFS